MEMTIVKYRGGRMNDSSGPLMDAKPVSIISEYNAKPTVRNSRLCAWVSSPASATVWAAGDLTIRRNLEP